MSGVNGVSSNAALYALYQQFGVGNPSTSSNAGATSQAGSSSATNSSSALDLLALLALSTPPTTPAGTGQTNDASTNNSSQTGGTTTSGSTTTAGNTTLATLRTQIESAVAGVLQNTSQSQLSSDPGSVLDQIRTAVDQTLQNDGLAPPGAGQTQGAHGHHHHHGGGSAAAAGSSSQSSSSSSGSSSASSSNSLLGILSGSTSTGSQSASSSSSALGSASTGNGSSTGNSLLDTLLSQNNISPAAFQSSLYGALVGSQNGSLDLGQLFQNFPPGQAVNALV